MLIHYSNRRQTHAGSLAVGGHGVVSGRLESGKVGSKSGQSGQVSLFWSFALDFAHDSSLSLLGTGQLTLWQGPCFAFRFPASGSHDDMMTRCQQCIFAFWHRAIISLLYHCFCCDCPGLVRADVPGQYRGGRPSCPIRAGQSSTVRVTVYETDRPAGCRARRRGG